MKSMQVKKTPYQTMTTVDRRDSVEPWAVSDWVRCAHWLSNDVLLVVSNPGVKLGARPYAVLTHGDASEPIDVRSLALTSPADEDVQYDADQLLLVRFPPHTRGDQRCGRLEIHAGDSPLVLQLADLAPITTDLQTLAREYLTGLEPDVRNAILEFLGSGLLADTDDEPGRLRLSKRLHTLREALRERLPYCVIAQDQPRGLNVEAILAVDERFFYVRGWMHNEDANIVQLTAVSPEGSRTPILDNAFHFPRPDVKEFYSADDATVVSTGFIAAFESGFPSYKSNGWLLEMYDTDGAAIEIAAPPIVRDPTAIRDALLADLAHEQLPRENLRRCHIFPAMERLQARIRDLVAIESIDAYGTPPESPDVSVLIPLYQRIDFLEHQLAQFVHDPELERAEIIYILDSPEQASELTEYAAQLFRLYRTPFQVVTLKRNSGFALANNIGAALSRGRKLLLLNSDVLPDRPGWLGTMLKFYDSTPKIGALGPKLLYEDGSLQHAGMYFLRQTGACLWQNQHYFKGLHRSLPAANVSRPVPAVTGACLMIDRDLYRDLGGLRGSYVQGDFEDSDLCLRLIEAGYENWYLPDVELYHLEGQSYPGPLRELTFQYNSWLHTHLWNEQIESVMARYPLSTAVVPTRSGTTAPEDPDARSVAPAVRG